jgi:hypothetical protein
MLMRERCHARYIFLVQGWVGDGGIGGASSSSKSAARLQPDNAEDGCNVYKDTTSIWLVIMFKQFNARPK